MENLEKQIEKLSAAVELLMANVESLTEQLSKNRADKRVQSINPKLYTVKEVATYLHTSDTRIRRLIDAGKI